jgi:short-subunit dehydrogenase
MKLQNSRVLLTGAAGGIGRVIALQLLKEGAQVLLVDRDSHALERVMASLPFGPDRFEAHVGDLTSAATRSALCGRARSWRGGVNVLINNAGLNPFALYEDLTAEQIDLSLAVNLQAPMHLCRELLPHLGQQASAAIVNVGSVFGAIGYPGYVAYSTTKFAVRGFTEALRRELADSAVSIHYFAPRATRTSINSAAVENMNAQLGVAMDPPERVARELVNMLRRGRTSAVVGWPEKLFVRINAILPGIVDRAIRRQLPIIRRSASRLRACAAVLALVIVFGLMPRHALAQQDAMSAELLDIQHAWEKASYETGDSDAKKRLLEELSIRSESFAQKYPGRAEPLVWEGIVLSSYAGAKGGLGALSLAKKSRDCLLQAVKLDPGSLQGSAYTSLGALYYKVPGWPLGFGDRDKAAHYLRKALDLNPQGIDPHYFFGEFLYEQGDYAGSLSHLQKALSAPSRPDRPVADAGRREEISALIAKVRAKQS